MFTRNCRLHLTKTCISLYKVKYSACLREIERYASIVRERIISLDRYKSRLVKRISLTLESNKSKGVHHLFLMVWSYKYNTTEVREGRHHRFRLTRDGLLQFTNRLLPSEESERIRRHAWIVCIRRASTWLQHRDHKQRKLQSGHSLLTVEQGRIIWHILASQAF